MKKFISYFFVFILIFFLTLFYTNFFNPFIVANLEKKLSKEYDLEVASFQIKPNKIQINFLTNNEILTIINMDYFLPALKFEGNYRINADSLQNFGVKIDEKIDFNGSFNGRFKKLNIDGSGKIFDGNFAFEAYKNGKKLEKLKTFGQNLELNQILALKNRPNIFQGRVDLKVDLDKQDEELNGRADIQIFNVELVKEPNFLANINLISDIKNSIAKIDGNLTTAFVNLNLQNTIYDFKKDILNAEFKTYKTKDIPIIQTLNLNGVLNLNSLQDKAFGDGKIFIKEINFYSEFVLKNEIIDMNYSFFIEDLRKLKLKNRLIGELKVDGRAQFSQDGHKISLFSNLFDSKLEVELEGESLKAQIKNFQIKEVLKMLNQIKFFDGDADFDFWFDIKKEIGNFKIFINEGRISLKGFETLIRVVSGYDISKELYKNAEILGKIENRYLIFDANLKSQNSQILIKDAKINLKNGNCEIILDIKFNGIDAKIFLSGDVSKPKYRVESNFVKNKTAWIGEALSVFGINL